MRKAVIFLSCIFFFYLSTSGKNISLRYSKLDLIFLSANERCTLLFFTFRNFFYKRFVLIVSGPIVLLSVIWKCRLFRFYRSCRTEVLFKKGALRNFLWPEACIFIKKETLTQVFFCEFCKISKNTFSKRTPPVAASGFIVLIYLLSDIIHLFEVSNRLDLFDFCVAFVHIQDGAYKALQKAAESFTSLLHILSL